MSKPSRRAIISMEEQDAYTPWRYALCYTDRAGVLRRIKRRTHKRERREGKAEIQEIKSEL